LAYYGVFSIPRLLILVIAAEIRGGRVRPISLIGTSFAIFDLPEKLLRRRGREAMNTETHLTLATEAGANRCWPVNWSGVFAGGLAALAVALVTGLASLSVGAQIVGHGEQVVSWNK